MTVIAAEKMEVFSFGPVQKLYEAARAMVECDPMNGSDSMENCLVTLAEAVCKLEASAAYSDTLEHVRQIAADNYVDSSCDIDIDSSCLAHHNGCDGYWVGAWLYVNGEEVGDTPEDEVEQPGL